MKSSTWSGCSTYKSSRALTIDKRWLNREVWSKPSSCCRMRVNSNSRATIFLIEDVGDMQFSIEGVHIVAVSSFQLFLLCINSRFSYEK